MQQKSKLVGISRNGVLATLGDNVVDKSQQPILFFEEETFKCLVVAQPKSLVFDTTRAVIVIVVSSDPDSRNFIS